MESAIYYTLFDFKMQHSHLTNRKFYGNNFSFVLLLLQKVNTLWTITPF